MLIIFVLVKLNSDSSASSGIGELEAISAMGQCRDMFMLIPSAPLLVIKHNT